jgi:uncharacterized membrane protein
MTVFCTILWLAICTGMAAALTAFYGHYKTLPEFLTGPMICETDLRCSTLFKKKEASLLGIPNAFLGVLLYSFLAIGLQAHFPIWLLLCAASCGLAMSIYLGFNLIRNKRQCRICWTGHISNSIIWLTLVTKLVLSV